MTEPGELRDWLARIERAHPRERIELGLERMVPVAGALQLGQPAPLVISVAGTNGKGSCVALLDAALRSAGFTTAAYFSPHLLDFTERFWIEGQPAPAVLWCSSLARVEEARAGLPLSYFEFITLAMLDICQRQRVEVALLEVGLGGRLDAVNLVDADLAVISSIALDHQALLGEDREAIGAEKAGIIRPRRPVVCGDRDPPQSLCNHAWQQQSPLYIAGRDFDWRHEAAAGPTWTWWGRNRQGDRVERTALPLPTLALENAATAIQALELLALPRSLPPARQWSAALAAASLPGRCQRHRLKLEQGGEAELILDVAHNPAAAAHLAARIKPGSGDSRLLAVFGILDRKDYEGVVTALAAHVHEWFPTCAPAPGSGGVEEQRLTSCLSRHGLKVAGMAHDPQEAFQLARRHARGGDRILVFGSFYTVAAVYEAAVDERMLRPPVPPMEQQA